MDNRALKLECLNIASRLNLSPDKIVETAKAMWAFVKSVD
jgi:hypothetical protein